MGTTTAPLSRNAEWRPAPDPEREPAGVTEGEEELLSLGTEIRRIEHQLSDLNRTDETGRRLGVQEWALWRKRALGAHRVKVARHRWLKAWLKRRRVASQEARAQAAAASGRRPDLQRDVRLYRYLLHRVLREVEELPAGLRLDIASTLAETGAPPSGDETPC